MNMKTFSKSVPLGILTRDWAEAIEEGRITAYPWEVSEGEYCWLTEKQAKKFYQKRGLASQISGNIGGISNVCTLGSVFNEALLLC